MGLLLTLITGLFFLLGIILNKVFKNIDDISVLGVSLAFIVLINLIIFDIIPEVKKFTSTELILPLFNDRKC